MGTYTITTTPEEDTALEWKAGNPDPTIPVPPASQPLPPMSADEYLDQRVHAELATYITQYNVATSNNPPIDVATAYANGTLEQQAQVDVILGLPPPATSRRSA